MPRSGKAGSTPIRRSRRTTAGQSPARLGVGDGWAEASAGDWDTNNADDVIAAAAVPDSTPKKKKKAAAAPKKARVAKVPTKKKAAPATEGNNTSGARGDDNNTGTGGGGGGSSASAAANAALPCGHYADCLPGPVTTALFFNCAIAYLLCGSGVLPPYAQVALKAAPMAALLGWSLLDEPIKVLGSTYERALLSSALFYSLVGDIVLEADVLHLEDVFEVEPVAGFKLGFFEIGAAAFGVAHVCYALLLFRGATMDAMRGVGLLFVAFFFQQIAPPIFDMCEAKDPALVDVVKVYVGMLMLLASSAVIGSKHQGAAILGAALFCASDAILAVNKFAEQPLPYARAMVMVPYLSAQWFLVCGICE